LKQKNNIAYWNDTFREEYEGMSVDQGILIWAFSGACFVVRTPKTVLFLDPYFGGDPVESAPFAYRTTQIPLDPTKITRADAVLISHEHYDHCHEQTLEPMARNTSAEFYGPASAVKEMHSYDMPKDRVHEVKAGDRLEFNDIKVTVWPSYDKDEPQAIAYLLESGGIKVFFNGDGADGPAFDEVAKANIDIAMLAFGRTWYMDEARMLAAAKRLRPKLLLPFHWELWRAHTGNPMELGRLIEREKPQLEVRLLQVGDYLEYLPDGTFAKGR